MDLFEGYQEKEKNPAAKKREGCASADSILDGHDGDDLDASFQLDALLAKSCPHLSHRLVSSGTQTDDNTAPQKRRAPQIGTTRYWKSNNMHVLELCSHGTFVLYIAIELIIAMSD